ncbi:MAG: hypothetical protein M1616_00765 [Candidatus Thermoplasmatota archaeon]|jgi:hypothetical protein|nr:hypothetical protein [Candidatus Thermoplasmatota archaeon]
MKSRFVVAGIVVIAIGLIFFEIRDHRLNFLIPVAVGVMLFLYGILSR